jgi:hypothetical protein
MKMRRKLFASLSAVLVTLSMAPAVSAATYTDCSTDPAGYHPTWYVFRDTATYYAAQGEVVIRQLSGCTHSDGSANQDYHAQVWPANIQGTNEFKQIGYGNDTSGGTAMNWWATENGGSGFDQNVTGMSLAFYPAIGDTIRFSIYRYGSYWRLYVNDLSHAGWYGWRDILAVGSSGNEVWYGIEDHSWQSQFGSSSGTNQTRLRGLSYRLSAGGAWTYLTGTTKTTWNEPLGIGEPTCWIESVATYAGPIDPAQTSLNGYTANTC